MNTIIKLATGEIVKFPCIVKSRKTEKLVLFVAERIGTILEGNFWKNGNEMGLCYKTFVPVSDPEFWEIAKEPITITFKSSHVFTGRNFPRNEDGKEADFRCVARNIANNEIALFPDKMRGTIIGKCLKNRLGKYFANPDFDEWQVLDEITITFNSGNI